MSKALNVLFNAVAAKSGGAAAYVQNLARQILVHGTPHHYTFIVPSGHAQNMPTTNPKVEVLETDVGFRSGQERLWWDQVELRRLLHRRRVDVLVSSSDFAMWFAPCPQILLLRNALFFSDLYASRFLARKSARARIGFELRRRLVAQSASWADLVVTASKAMMADVVRSVRLPAARRAVNPFGVPMDRFAGQVDPDFGRQPGAGFRILYVSEYSDYKNLGTLLRAVRLLRERGVSGFTLSTTMHPRDFPGVEVSTRGDDLAIAGDPLVAPFVEFGGAVPYAEVSALYRARDLFVFPSLVESFGHPLLEAMASALPILASDIPVCRELCGDAAIYFDPLDPGSLAERIVFLMRQPNLRRTLVEAGRTRVVRDFDFRDHVVRFVGLVEGVGTMRRVGG